MARPESLELLRAHLSRWYVDFDWQAMEVALAAIVAHYAAPQTQAIWPFFVGAQRTGKTEIITALAGLGAAQVVGDVTPKSLMSAYQDKGMLHALYEQGKHILLWKDFTSMLSKRDEDLLEVLAILREVADGEFHRWTGMGAVAPWHGKLTIIGGCTDALERHWQVMQSLGSRFLIVRLATAPGPATSAAARIQVGKENAIHAESQRLTQHILALPLKMSEINPEHDNAINYLAALSMWLNQVVDWSYNRHEVEGVRARGGTGALGKQLDVLARCRAALYNRSSTDNEDYCMIRRVALDTTPLKRLAVLKALQVASQDVITLAATLAIPRNDCLRRLKALEAIQIIQKNPDASFALSNLAQTYWEIVYPSTNPVVNG